jgi:nucleotide-binding universal stress UspA family protein
MLRMIPPKVVLAAVDFSEPSAVALTFASRLASESGATLHVIYAEDPFLADAARQAGIDLAADTQQELARFVAAALGERPGPATTVIETGPAIDVILEAARRVHADVLVLGSHGMSGAERLMFGSTTEGVLRRAPVSAMVVPPTWQPSRTDAPGLSGAGPVVVGVDLGESSSATLAAACRLASLLGTSVEAAHVVTNPPVLARWRGHAESAVRDRLAAGRAKLTQVLQDAKCEVSTRAVAETGDVPERLAAIAAAGPHRQPILVLGRHRRDAKGGPPGAIAYRVLSLARVPVLMHVATE